MPVLLGTAMAVVIAGAEFHPWRFLAALAAMVMWHAGANILSDITDYNKGLDTTITPVSGAVVRGMITTQEAFVAAVALFFTGGALGVILVALTGWPLLVVGIVGLLIGVCYTVGPALKYRALGDLAVFLDFGTLGALGAWMVQTGSPSWAPVAWSVPMSLLVIGILHANNWRDIATDSGRRIRTCAGILGDRGSIVYYGFLLFGSQLLVIAFAGFPLVLPGLPRLPWPCLITLAVLPEAATLWRRARRRHRPKNPLDFVVLDGATARYNLHFGLLYTAGLWLGRWLG